MLDQFSAPVWDQLHLSTQLDQTVWRSNPTRQFFIFLQKLRMSLFSPATLRSISGKKKLNKLLSIDSAIYYINYLGDIIHKLGLHSNDTHHKEIRK